VSARYLVGLSCRLILQTRQNFYLETSLLCQCYPGVTVPLANLTRLIRALAISIARGSVEASDRVCRVNRCFYSATL
jgi:hypothetical protein